MSIPAILTLLNELLDVKADALPSGFNKARFIDSSEAYLKITPGADQFNVEQAAKGLVKGAILGLDFYKNECHLILDGGEIFYRSDYKGERKLVMKHSVRTIVNTYSKLVREGDKYREYIEGGEQKIDFDPLPMNTGKVIGAFAVAQYADGGMTVESMTAEEIEATRVNYSSTPDGKAWRVSQGEMYRKTVSRRLYKAIELDFAIAEQYQAFEDGSGFEVRQQSRSTQSRPRQQSPFNQSVSVDGGHEEAGDGTDKG
jgi:recombination protein RecT